MGCAVQSLARIPGFRQRIIPEPHVPSRARSQARGTRLFAFSYPEPFLRAVGRGALAKSITGYHKNMVRKQYSVLELANQMPVRIWTEYYIGQSDASSDITARKKGSEYENGLFADATQMTTSFPGSSLLCRKGVHWPFWT